MPLTGNAADQTSRSELLSALVRALHTPRPRYPTDEQRERSRKRLWTIVEPWLPLAENRLTQAQGSPSDHARWKALIAGVQPLAPGTATETPPTLIAMSDSTAALLRALREAEAEGPSVDKIADHVRTAIQDGVFLPGTKLNVGQIAADLGYPAITKGRAELALQDLQAEGLLVFRNRWRVTEPTDHPTQIAGMLRTFIQTGVYPPGSHMPIATALAREFVAQTKSLLEAWHELRDEGAVVIRAGSRPAVAAVPPFPVSASPAPDALVTQLRPLAMDEADFSPHIIRKTCDQALAWWKARTSPPPGALKHTYGYLIAATLQLIRSKPDTPENQLRLRRTAALALDPHNVTSSPLWRTACIAVVVGELLDRGSA